MDGHVFQSVGAAVSGGLASTSRTLANLTTSAVRMLAEDLEGRCAQGGLTGWLEGLNAGSALFYISALLVAVALGSQVAAQLTARARRSCCASRTAEHDADCQPLLPTSTAASGGRREAGSNAPPLPPLDLAPWTTLALAELLVAS